jgi:leucine-rich repeat protein SHOC2
LRGAVPMVRDLRIIATAPFDNKLTKVPMDVWSLLTLQHLHIERNEIAIIPPQIGQLASLQYLYLAYNHIKTIAPEIKNLTALTYLNVSGNQLVSLPNIGNKKIFQKN